MFVYELIGCEFESPVAVTETSDMAPVSSKKSLDIQATIECRFTLKHVRDMIRTNHFNTTFSVLILTESH